MSDETISALNYAAEKIAEVPDGEVKDALGALLMFQQEIIKDMRPGYRKEEG